MSPFWRKFFKHVRQNRPIFLAIIILIILVIFTLGFRLGREWCAYVNRFACKI